MESKQTAVEWLSNQIECFGNKHELQMSWNTLEELVEQAKEKEKEQIIDAFGIGCQVESTRLIGYQDMAEQYYQETYEK
jgi:DNA-directed RNA polymerase subunit N (RpoN/RPB10)